MAVRCSARSYIYSRRAERAFGGGYRHELIRIVLGSIPVRAVEAQVTWIVVVIIQPFGALEAHGGRRVGEAGGPAAAREMGRPALKKTTRWQTAAGETNDVSVAASEGDGCCVLAS